MIRESFRSRLRKFLFLKAGGMIEQKHETLRAN